MFLINFSAIQWRQKAVFGGTLAGEEDMEKTHILPDKADMFIAYATVPGYR